MLDLHEGDILVVGAKQYAIRACNDWSTRIGSTPSMRRMCRVTASTLRNPAVVGAVRGDPVSNLTSIKCTPLDPVSQVDGIRLREVLQSPYELLQTIVDGGDVFYHLFVEELRK